MRTPTALLLAPLLVSICLTVSFAQDAEKHEPVLDLSSMDKTADPCIDFFSYSCGGWIKNNPIPPDQSSWSAYSKVQDANLARLRGILERAAEPAGGRPAYLQKIGDYYASCIDEKTIEELGARPLRDSLDTISNLKSKADLADVVGKLA